VGAEGTCGNYSRVQSSGGGIPPGSSSRHRKHFRPNLGIEHHDGKRLAMTRYLSSNRRELQGKIASIFAADTPQGRLKNAEEGFSQRFPSSRRGFRSFTPFCTHSHRKWGRIGSRGVAADRDRQWGGRSYGILQCQPRGYEYGYGMPCERASFGLMPLCRENECTPDATCASSGVPIITDSSSL